MSRFALRATYPGFTLDARAAFDAPCTALFGASGSGKSTILEAIAGVRDDVAGEVEIAGVRVDGLPARARRIGWMPQDGALFPHRTLRQQIAFATDVGGADANDATRAIDALELGALLDRRPHELSGGERQRGALARALAARPRLLMLDEPLAALDRPLRARIVPFLVRVWRDLGVPMLLVTHDPLEVTAIAQHVLVLEAGRVVREGNPRGLFPSAVTFGGLLAMSAENHFVVDVVGRAEGSLRVRTPLGLEFEIASLEGFPDPGAVSLRAEDVLIATTEPHGISAQNVIPATIERIEDLHPARMVVATASGETIRARLVPKAVASLGLEPGKSIWLVIKANAVIPVPKH
ncbi:MAG: ATP-binding cassette domain-containing protein [Planctomycetes bacterium]|nr:ATP-binding cassette domain-containing protein [Planctomycetota bacterium]